jgi:hypothetical protein
MAKNAPLNVNIAIFIPSGIAIKVTVFSEAYGRAMTTPSLSV